MPSATTNTEDWGLIAVVGVPHLFMFGERLSFLLLVCHYLPRIQSGDVMYACQGRLGELPQIFDAEVMFSK